MNCTGYTAGIESGEYKSPKDFLKRCLRQFGVLISMRDEPLNAPIPKEIKVDSYYPNELKEAEKIYKDMSNKPDSYWKKEYEKEWAKAKKSLDDVIAKNAAETRTLENYATAIRNWDCSNNCKPLKDFALDQLARTKPVRTDFDLEYLKDLEKKGVEGYKKDQLDFYQRDIELAKEHLEEEKKDVAEKNKYLKEFLDEIEKVGE
jgi:hypothetical protein